MKIWFSALVLLMSIQIFSQSRVTGSVYSATDENPMYDVEVRLRGTNHVVRTDRIGYFQFLDVTPGHYVLDIKQVSYAEYEQSVTVEEGTKDLGIIYLQYAPQDVTVGLITLTEDELASEESGAQSSVGLLQSSRDVFARTAAFELGSFWYRPRGYDNKYNDVLFNGVRMNKISNDRVNFGNWGGLNDITRYPRELTFGIEPSDHYFSDLGGVTYFDTRPSNLRAGHSFAYSLTNRSYRQRLMYTYNTGLSAKGWGFAASASRRWAEEGRMEGTFYDAWAYYLGVEKKFNDNHTLYLSAIGAPTRRSTASPNTQEVFDLKGVTYNAYWGWQDGVKRNERVRKTHEPLITLTHDWKINERTNLLTTAGVQFGEDSRSRLDWYRANNPSPLYYRKFPSWFQNLNDGDANHPSVLAAIDSWQNDENYYQINWQELYNANLLSPTGRASYTLVADVNRDLTTSMNSLLRTELSENFVLRAGVYYQGVNSSLFRRLEDLLGAQYALDKNPFAREYQSGDNDENNPDRHVLEGEKMQYDYEIAHNQIQGFVQGNYSVANWDFTGSFKLSNTSMQREGHFNHFAFNDSYGKSDKYSFLDYGAKLGVVYKIDGRNYVTLNAAHFTNAPTVNEVFPLQRLSNRSIPDLKSAVINSGDINYILRAPRLRIRATAYASQIKNEIEQAFGYIQVGSTTGSTYNVFASEIMANVEKQYLGTELGVEANLTTRFTANVVASLAQNLYKNNPDLYRFTEVPELGDIEGLGGTRYVGTTYLRNYRVATSPQKAASVGLQYRDPKYWWVGISANYLADNYVSIAGARRTEAMLRDPEMPSMPYPEVTEESLRRLLAQERFSDEFMVNLNIGKTFRIGRYYVGLTGMINNVLNNKNYKTSGFEQLRLGNFRALDDTNFANVFGNRYWYDPGTSYFLNMFVRF